MHTQIVKIPKLMALKHWRVERFHKPIPKNTALRWVQNGEIPAKKIGGEWFVMLEEEVFDTGCDRVNEILRAG